MGMDQDNDYAQSALRKGRSRTVSPGHLLYWAFGLAVETRQQSVCELGHEDKEGPVLCILWPYDQSQEVLKTTDDSLAYKLAI